SFIAMRGKLYPVPEGFHLLAPSRLWPILVSPLLSLSGKWRMLQEFRIRPSGLDDETLGSFVRRRLGQEVLDRLAQPLVAGIFGAEPDQLSLRSTFPNFLELEKHGSLIRGMMAKAAAATGKASGARYSLFVTLKNGLQSLSDRLAERLGPSSIRTGIQIQSMTPASWEGVPGWRLQLSNGETLDAEAVCLAVPSFAAARLLQPVDAELASDLSAIPYGDSLTAHFAFPAKAIRDPLNGVGLVVPAVEKRVLGACTFVHRKFAGRCPGDVALLRAFAGGSSARALLRHSDHEITDKLLKDLKELLGISAAPIFTTLSRYPSALPHYTLGHGDRVRRIEDRAARLQGLALAGNWQGGVGIPDSIESGEAAASSLIIQICKNYG
ncbi:MAG TPA: protoporphyrinogen oxidase, partial [Elusimicrobiota bacterium]|nr:protoporphyrinogen oxidase [Elusimicrobiota bacterium]